MFGAGSEKGQTVSAKTIKKARPPRRPALSLAPAFLAVLLAASTATPAAAREDTRNMTCGEAQAFVRQEGAVVMATSTFLYIRFVADQGRCERGQVAVPAYAPTADSKQCAVGYRCAASAD